MCCVYICVCISGRYSLTPESINTPQEASSPGSQLIDTQPGIAAEQSRAESGESCSGGKRTSDVRSFMQTAAGQL